MGGFVDPNAGLPAGSNTNGVDTTSNADDNNNDTRSYGGFAGRKQILDADGNVVQQGMASGADQATNRYQTMGSLAATRGPAFTGDYGAYNGAMGQAQDARGSQQSALALQQQAAMGTAPSAAQLAGQNQLDAGLHAQLAGAASVGGSGLARAAAIQGAQNGAAAYQQQGANNLAVARAGEMAQARDAYQQGATGIRQGDYAGANLGLQKVGQQQQEGQYDQSQNDATQLAYEGLGHAVQQDNLGAQTQDYKTDEAQWATQAQIDANRTNSDIKEGIGIGGAVAKGVGGFLSDVFVKDVDGPIDNHVGYGPEMRSSDWLSDNMPAREPSFSKLGDNQGYADSRKGQAGYMFGGAPEAESGFAKNDYKNDAPGTEDFVHAMGGDATLKGSGNGHDFDDRVQAFANPTGGAKEPQSFASRLAAALGSAAGSDAKAKPGPGPGNNPPADDNASFSQRLAAALKGAAGEDVPSDETAKDIMGGKQNGGLNSSAMSVLSGNALGPIDEENNVVQSGMSQGGAMTSDRTAKVVRGTAPMTRAALSLASSVYRYKPQFTPPDQHRGEVNVGPMAQNMARDPVARTAIERDPRTGKLAINQEKGLKITMGSVASLAKQSLAQAADIQDLARQVHALKRMLGHR